MSSTYSSISTYRETRVKTASQGQIIVMLYDEAIRQMDIAADLMEGRSKHFDQINQAVMKARDIITELMVALDMERGGEFAERMFALYHWFNQQLLDANFRKDASLVKTVRSLMTEIRDAWNQIATTTSVEGRAKVGLNIAG